MTLFWVGAAWMAGIWAGDAARLLAWQWGCLAGIACLAWVAFRRKPPFQLLFGLTLALCLGAVRHRIAAGPLPADHVAQFNDGPSRVILTGLITSYPDLRDRYANLEVEVQTLRREGQGTLHHVEGRVLVQATPFTDWAYGDRVRVLGFLETPPSFEGFSYRDYLARQGIHTRVTSAHVRRMGAGRGSPVLRAIYALRGRAVNTIHALFPDPEASLLAGILTGVERGIPPKVREAFDNTGTAHIIAISGFNITIVAALLMNLFGRILGARRGLFLAGLGIACYTLLVGADAAVVRAAIMGSLTLIARLLGRQTFGLASLSSAAILMTAIDSNVLWDVGFQLSFAATLGLMLYAPPLESAAMRLLSGFLGREAARKAARPIGEFVLFTLAAQITTLPLAAFHFDRLPLVSPLANAVILPAQSALMITGGLATILGLLWLPLGQPLAWIAWPFPAFTIRAVTLFDRLPLSSLLLNGVPAGLILALYAALFGFTALAALPADRRPTLAFSSLHRSLALTGLLVCTLLTWRAGSDRPDGYLHLILLDVGAGDALLIRSPGGRFVLVNGGPSPTALSDALGRRLPLLDRRLDWLIIAGNRSGQVEGLAACIPRFPPRNVLSAASPGGGRAHSQLMEALLDKQIPVLAARERAALDLKDGARLEVLAQGDHGSILLVRYKRFRALLGAGADPALASALPGKGLLEPVTVALLPEGGFAPANPREWLEELDPQVVLLSAGSADRALTLNQSPLDQLEGRTILRTDRHGWIEITTDGRSLWVQVERTPMGGQSAPNGSPPPHEPSE